ncbi:radical SAM protein [bacterium]|nr:radical SAM protein [bacterium]
MSQPVTVREVECKSVLNKSSLFDYSLNCYTGCAHACVYCYARYMQRFHPHPEPWGQFVDVKINAPQVLKNQLRRARPGDVFVSSACDGWQPLEAKYKLTRECCRLLVDHGFIVNALTKSSLILRDLDVLAGSGSKVAVTITTLDENLRLLWEPCASPVAERLRVLAEAKRAGLKTGSMIGPLLPYLSDSPESIHAILKQLADLGVDDITVDALNPRPKVWESVAALVSRRWPSLREPYRKILFDPTAREAYLADLRARVQSAAIAAGIPDRVWACF